MITSQVVPRRSLHGTLVFGLALVLRLVKQEVGSQLFVLVAGKVGLDSLIAVKSETT